MGFLINEKNITKRENYCAIDLCKLIMSICVVAIHTQPLKNCNDSFVNEVCHYFVNLAVPFFFIASGFLLGKKLSQPYCSENNISAYKKYLFKNIRLFVTWTLIYLPLAIYYFCSVDASLLKSVCLYARNLIFMGEQYNSWHLWYLLSTIYTAIALLIFCKVKLTNKKLLVVSIFFLILSVSLSWFVGLESDLPQILEIFKNIIRLTIATGRIFRGAYFIPIGILISKIKVKKLYSGIVFLVTVILGIIIPFYPGKEFLLGVTALSLFMLVSTINIKPSPIYTYFRKMSTIIYFTHMYVWSFYYKIVYNEKTFGIDSFIATTLICVVVSLVYFILKERKNKKI